MKRKFIKSIFIASVILLSGCSDSKMAYANNNLLTALIRSGIYTELDHCEKDGSSPCTGKLSGVINSISNQTGMDIADSENYIAETIVILSKTNRSNDEITKFIEDRDFMVSLAKADYENLNRKKNESSDLWK